jgi:ribonuclease D
MIAQRKLSITVDGRNVQVFLHSADLAAGVAFQGPVAVDCEAMGLGLNRDRLCLVQLSDGGGEAHLVQIGLGQTQAPQLKSVLEDPTRLKLFHFGRFDIAMLKRDLAISCAPVYCTKIASKLARTYTDKHGLKEVVKELLGRELSKENQSSDWGAEALTDSQLAYAAADVLHLHEVRAKLDAILLREGRHALAQACFDFLPTRAALDLAGWEPVDIFAHS